MPHAFAEPSPIGRHHPLLTEFRRVFRSGPGEAGKLAIEGPRLVAEALRCGLRLDTVLFSRTGFEQLGPKLAPQLSKHVAVHVADDAVFAAAMDADHPQGVAALAAFAPPPLAAVFGDAGTPPLVAVAAGLQDPGNLGTLIRAADAFGATGVVTLDSTVSPYNPKAVRASAGSLFHLPVVAKIAADDLVAACRERSLRIVVAAPRGDNDAVASLAGPLCLVIGQEAAGVPRELQRAADATVAIPMVREVESLNAGVAGAILLYEAARQRRPL